MLLSEILNTVRYECESFTDCEISDIAYDSRKAQDGVLFVALCGALSDGHDYALSAYERGARCFLLQRKLELPFDAVQLITENTRAALSVISGNFFLHPEKKLTVIGVTGTKGKTTVTHMLRAVLEGNGIKTGVIGTAGAFFSGKQLPTVNTTPESYEIMKLMSLMLRDNCRAVCMEVSSLGLKHHRVDGITFDIAVFTNLSPDHIGGNEHSSFEEYCECKKRLFKMCRYAVLNGDDEFTKEITKDIKCPYDTFSLTGNGDFCGFSAKKLRDKDFFGVSFQCSNSGETAEVKVSMPGYFSIYNALAAYAVAKKMDIPSDKIGSALLSARVKGRDELLSVPADYDVFIDYAHNGVSMKGIIESVRDYSHRRIITVFGSVGDRAQLRRREMGLVSGSMADYSILTTDDPNFEDPYEICKEIASYIESTGGKYEIIPDRREAVFKALDMAESGDIVLILGKGQETAQKVKGKLIPYSDHETVKEYFDIKKEGN